MKNDVKELLFASRDEFHSWLNDNAETSDGVWLIFGKKKAIATLSGNEALEEALCFGWIDGQIKSIDDSTCKKYFARRREKSVWSEKNKKITEVLRKKKLMTKLGERAIETAKKNGTWDTPGAAPVTEDQVKILMKKLAGILPASDNFGKMSPSVRLTYTRRYLSFKTEEARERDFLKIVDRLNKNLKPM